MNILILNDFYEQIGGTERYVNNLKQEFESKNHKVDIFTGRTTYEDSLKTKSALRLLSLFFSFKYLFRIKKRITLFKPDIIIINNIFYELSPSFLLLAKNIPVVMVVHDNQIYSPMALQRHRTGKMCKQVICEGCDNCMGFGKSRLEYIKRRFHKILLRNVDIYVGNSNYVNQIIESRRIGKTVSFKYGISLLPFSIIKNFNDITYIGRLVEEKGVQNIIYAMPDILLANPKATLNITGEGDYKEVLVKIVDQLGLQKKIVFHSGKSHDQIYLSFKQAGIIIVPSVWDEPFCQVGLEAMSVGRPVVASNMGGIKDWLQDGVTGFFVEPNKPSQIAEKVNKLLSDKALMIRMSKSATKAAQDYSIEKHIENIERLCVKLVEQYRSIPKRYKNKLI